PAHFAFDAWREFHPSWYRREGTAYRRPKVTVSLPAALLPECATQQDAVFIFEEYGDQIESRINPDSGANTRLVAIKCNIQAGGAVGPLLAPNGNLPSRLWNEQQIRVPEALVNEAAWSIFDANNAPALNMNRTPENLYGTNTKWHQAISK